MLKKELKQQYVLNSEDYRFEDDLRAMVAKLNPTVVLDCVSGHLVGDIAESVPHNSVIISYGQLSN